MKVILLVTLLLVNTYSYIHWLLISYSSIIIVIIIITIILIERKLYSLTLM